MIELEECIRLVLSGENLLVMAVIMLIVAVVGCISEIVVSSPEVVTEPAAVLV